MANNSSLEIFLMTIKTLISELKNQIKIQQILLQLCLYHVNLFIEGLYLSTKATG